MTCMLEIYSSSGLGENVLWKYGIFFFFFGQKQSCERHCKTVCEGTKCDWLWRENVIAG